MSRLVFSKDALGASPALLTRISTGPNFCAGNVQPAGDRLGTGHVEAVDDHGVRANLCSDGLKRFSSPPSQRHACTFGSQHTRNRRANAAAGAGDEGMTAREFAGRRHRFLTSPARAAAARARLVFVLRLAGEILFRPRD